MTTFTLPAATAAATVQGAFAAGVARFKNALLALVDGDVAREPQTVEEVLALARRLESSEPGLAADLRGAALRHSA